MKQNSLFEVYRNTFLLPTSAEIIRNPPSRSAKLRYATRRSGPFVYPENFKLKFKKYTDLENDNS